jgi:hypothetical protein
MAFAIMRLIVAIVAVSIVTGFSPLQSRSLARFSRLSMAFEFTPPSFDSILQKFGGSTTSATTQTTAAPEIVQKIVAAPVTAAPAVQKVISVPPVAPSTALSGGEFSIGLGLGLLPYLLLPVLALNAAKGLLKPPKPLPVPVEPTTTVGAYTKSLQEGLNEGIKELFSEQTADTDLTKKGIKLSAAGFGSAIVLTAVLFATSNAKEESKVIAKKPVVPAAIVKIVTPPVVAPISPPAVPVPAVSAPAPAAVIAPVAAPVAATAPVIATSEKAASEKAASEKAASEKAASEKAASEKAASEKAASEKAASEKAVSEKAASEKAASAKVSSEKAASEKAASEKTASEKAASEKAASEKAASEKAASEKAASEKAASEKAASEKATSEKAASEKTASEKAASEKAVKEAVVPVSVPAKVEQTIAETYAPVVPAGMQPDKVDFEALKLLRVRTSVLSPHLLDCRSLWPARYILLQ